MGYVEIVKNGRVVFDSEAKCLFCDKCETSQPISGGREILDLGRESVMWFCSKCRYD